MNSDARSCAEERATVQMNCWRQKNSSPFRATRKFLFGHDGIFEKSRKWVRGVHSSLGINHGVDNHGFQK